MASIGYELLTRLIAPGLDSFLQNSPQIQRVVGYSHKSCSTISVVGTPLLGVGIVVHRVHTWVRSLMRFPSLADCVAPPSQHDER